MRHATRLRSLACLGALLALTGCSAIRNVVPATPSPDLTGSWQIGQLVPVAPATTPLGFLGYLSGGANGQVAGQFRLSVSALGAAANCAAAVKPLDVINFTGTNDASGLLTLTSASFAGGSVATVSLHLLGDPHTQNAGTLRIDGGACAVASGVAYGVFVSPVSGTFKGTLLAAPAAPITVTMHLTQAPVTSFGTFGIPVTGDVTIAGSTCTLNFPALDAAVLGAGMVGGVVPTTGNGTGVSFLAVLDPHATSLMFPSIAGSTPFAVSGGTCSVGNYTGTLTRQ